MSRKVINILSISILWTIVIFHIITIPYWPEQCDFAMFMLSGQQAAKRDNPYALDIDGIAVLGPNLNPPPSLLLFEPYSYLSHPIIPAYSYGE